MPISKDSGRKQTSRIESPKKNEVSSHNPPARKVITRSRQTIRTAYPSTKAKQSNDCESGLESRVAAFLELSPAVANWSPQPFKVKLRINGEIKKYTPDFKVVMRNGLIKIIEAKPLKNCLDLLVREKLSAAQHYFDKAGMSFEIVTEEDLGSKQLYRNLNLLRYYLRMPFKNSEKSFARNLVMTFSPVSISDLESTGLEKQTIYALIANGALKADLTIPLGPDSNLTLFLENDDDKCLFNGRSAFDLE